MVGDEYVRLPGEEDDPLGEDHDTVVPGLVHRYPDRVLFLTTGTCSTYCRYCTRSRLVGNPGGEYQFNVRNWELALDYLEEHTEVRDVLFEVDRKSTRLNSSHQIISYAVFCLKKKKKMYTKQTHRT